MAKGSMIGARLSQKEMQMLVTVRESLIADWPTGVALPTLSDTVRRMIYLAHRELVGPKAHAAFITERSGEDE